MFDKQNLKFFDMWSHTRYGVWFKMPTNNDKDVYIAMISKNASSILFDIVLESNGIISNISEHGALNGYWGFLKHLAYPTSHVLKQKDVIKVAVIRDPLERIESAYNTIGFDMTIEQYVDCCCWSLEHLPHLYIDRHISSQFIQTDFNLINKIVPMEKLNDYLVSIGINNTRRINCAKERIKINDQRLNNLLVADYKKYNFYKNSSIAF